MIMESVVRVSSPEAAKITIERPGLLKVVGSLLLQLSGAEPGQSVSSVDSKTTLIFLGKHSDEDRNYYKLEYIADSGSTETFFSKRLMIKRMILN
ncbi:MAG: hypothetical protein RJB39_785 [Candidatus Parcubacteria bacterium]|jgi:hypothetical protein